MANIDQTCKFSPEEVWAIGQWLGTMIQDADGLRLCIYPRGKEKQITKQHMVNILYSAAEEIKQARENGGFSKTVKKSWSSSAHRGGHTFVKRDGGNP